MELRTLRVFVEVVRQGGFSQAAKVVFATQSTVSKAIKQLEEELGVPLLDRLGRRSSLTAPGEAVYRRALRILADRDDLVAELDELRGLKRGTLRLALPPVGTSFLFAPVFAAYHSRYPGIDIHLAEPGGDRAKEMLLTGAVDLISSLLPVSGEFEWQEIRAEPLVALLPLNHPLVGKKSIELASLQEIPFILLDAGFALHRLIMSACNRRGFEPVVVAATSQFDFMIELAASGLGVTILPRTVAQHRNHPALGIVPLEEPELEWRIAMMWRRGGYLSPAARAWLSLMKELPAGT
jgi:DNA-binding transcriptional LysR family regulator